MVKLERFSKSTAGLLSVIALGKVHARTWRDINTYHALNPVDSAHMNPQESDLFDFFPPTNTTTVELLSTKTPAGIATINPVHSLLTSDPVSIQTPAPTAEAFPPNPTPDSPPRSYFNYNTSIGAPYGPGHPDFIVGSNGFVTLQYEDNGWANYQVPNNFYWNEFGSNGFGPWKGVLENWNLDTSQCGNVGLQSPIDVRPSGVACVEHHQIRLRVSIGFSDVTKYPTMKAQSYDTYFGFFFC